jgi:hypothetical protein
MPATYENIATTTLTGDQTSVTFSSISASFTDLVLVINTFTSGTPTITGPVLQLSIGGVLQTGSDYSETRLSGNGSAASSSRGSNNTSMGIGQDSSTTTPSLAIAHFMNYSNTTTNKTVIMRNNRSDSAVSARAGLLRKTGAIDGITIYSPDNGSASTPFKSGSTFTLYGIKAA